MDKRSASEYVLPETNQSFIEQQMLRVHAPSSTPGMAMSINSLRTSCGEAAGNAARNNGRNHYLRFCRHQMTILRYRRDVKAENGIYSLQVTDELWETMYIDKIDLIAVDHPDSIDIF